jgi:hypothetical protein
MALPIKDGKITTPYNKKGKMWKSGFHTGVDFAVPVGTDIIAACDGVVQGNNWGKAYGKQVIVKAKVNGKDLWMIYAHCSKTMVKAGAKVTKGQHIAELVALVILLVHIYILRLEIMLVGLLVNQLTLKIFLLFSLFMCNKWWGSKDIVLRCNIHSLFPRSTCL